MGFWGSIGGGFLGAAGSIASSAIAAREAKKQRQWQERMSNTQYQRSMKDMREAGLNPMLAYKQGGAGTPSGGIGKTFDMGTAAMQGAKAGSDIHTGKGQRGLLREQMSTTAQQGAKFQTAQAVDRALETKHVQETAHSAASERLLDTQDTLHQLQIPGAALEAEINASAYGKATAYIKRGTDTLPSILGGLILGGRKGRPGRDSSTRGNPIAPQTKRNMVTPPKSGGILPHRKAPKNKSSYRRSN